MLGAPADAFATGEDPPDEWVLLEKLEQVVDGGRRVGVVEVDDEADADKVLAGLVVPHRIDPAAADLAVARAHADRPGADRVDHAVQRFRDLPDLLDAEFPNLRLATFGEAELADRRAGQRPPRALRENRHLRSDVGAGGEARELLAVLAAALVG
jgi:hypothetical protein